MAKKDNYKSVPRYINNVVKSTMFSAKDAISEITPNTAEFFTSNSDLFKSIIHDVRNHKTMIKTATNNIKESGVFASVKKMQKNAFEDLKTGNFYNKRRMEAQEEESFKKMFGDMDFDLDSSSPNYSSELTAKSVAAGTKMQTTAIESMGKTVANATIHSTESMIEHQNVLHAAQMVASERMFNLVNAALNDIATNIRGVFDNTKNSVEFMKTSAGFYDKSSNQMDSLIALNKEMTEMKRNLYEGYNKSNADNFKSDEREDVFNGGGTVNLSAYMKHVKGNVKNMWDTSILGSSVNMMKTATDGDAGFLDSMASSPLQFLSTFLAKQVIPGRIKKSMEGLDKTMGLFAKSGFLKLNTFMEQKGEDNPLYEMLNNIIGLDLNTYDKVKVGAYHKGPMPYNGLANKALVEVIPTYLRQIVSILSNKEEQIYNFEEGKFQGKDAIKNNYNNDWDSTFSGVAGQKQKITSMLSKFNLDENSKKTLNNDVNSFMQFLTKSGTFYDPKSEDFESMRNKGMVLEGDKDSYKLISSAFKMLSKHELMEKDNDIVDTIFSRKNRVNDLNKTLTGKGYTSLLDGSNINQFIDKDTKTNNRLLKNNNEKIENYLLDIRGLLISGITVYPQKREEKWIYRLYRRRMNKFKQQPSVPVDPPASTRAASGSGNDSMNLSEAAGKGDGSISSLIQSALDSSDEDGESDNSNLVNILRNSGLTKSSTLLSNVMGVVTTVASTPSKFMTKIVDDVNENLVNILYPEENGKYKGMGFLEATSAKITDKIEDLAGWTMDNVLSPLKDFFFNKDTGILTKLKQSSVGNKFAGMQDKFSNYVFGTKDDAGKRSGGLLSNVVNNLSDMGNSTLNMITGKEYVSKVTGEKIEKRNDSVFSEIKSFSNKSMTYIKDSLFGNDKEEGLFNYFKDKGQSFFSSVSEKIFGDAGDGKMSAKEFWENKMKPAMPKTLASGLLGAGLSLFTPLGLIGGTLLGSGIGFASTSDKFKNYLFGEVGADGDRKGGQLLGKDSIKYLKQAMPKAGAGAMLGAGLSLFTPFGLLGGAVLGSGVGFASASEGVKSFLFGEMGQDGKRNQANAIIKEEHLKAFKKSLPVGLVSTGALMALKSQLGVVGSFLLPGGPIGAAVAGLSLGMLSQKDSIKTFLFGDYDPEKNKREGGLFGQLKTFFHMEIFQPFRLFMDKFKANAVYFIKKNMINPVLDAFEPVKTQFKLLGSAIKEQFKIGWDVFKDKISNLFQQEVGKPFGEFMREKVLDPLKKFFGGLFGGLAKIVGGVISAPFKGLGAVGMGLLNDQKKKGQISKEVFQRQKDAKKERDAKTEKERETKLNKIKERESVLQDSLNVVRKGGYDIADKKVKQSVNHYDRYDDLISAFENNVVSGDKKKLTLMDRILGSVQKGFESVTDGIRNAKDKAVSSMQNKKAEILKERAEKELKQQRRGFLNNLQETRIGGRQIASVGKLRQANNVVNNTAINNGSVLHSNQTNINNSQSKSEKRKEKRNERIQKQQEKRRKQKEQKQERRHAKGGIFNSATTVRETEHYKDVVGEAGPEAVLPLEKFPDVLFNVLNRGSKKSKGMFSGMVGGVLKRTDQDLKAILGVTKEIKDKIPQPSTTNPNSEVAPQSATTYLNKIYREMRGQINGVGYNTELIANILVEKFGTPKLMPKGVRHGVHIIKGFFGKFFGFFRSPLGFIKKIAMIPINFIKGTVGHIIDTFKQAVGPIINAMTAIPRAIFGAVSGIAKMGVAVMQTIGPIIGQIGKGLAQGLGSIVKAAGTVITGAAKGIGHALEGVGETLGAIAGSFGKLIKGVSYLAVKIVPKLISGFGQLTKFAFGLVSKLGKSIFNGVGRILGIGNKTKYIDKGIIKVVEKVNVVKSIPIVETKIDRTNSILDSKLHSIDKHLSKIVTKMPNTSTIGGVTDIFHAEGGIMTNPTVIGRTKTERHIGGEAGPEAILPLSKFPEMIGKMFNFMKGNQNNEKQDNKIAHYLENIVKQITDIRTNTTSINKIQRTENTLNEAEHVKSSFTKRRRDVVEVKEESNKRKQLFEKMKLNKLLQDGAKSNKGTYGILHKLTKKGGILSKIGLGLISLLPIALKFFKAIKNFIQDPAGTILGLLSKIPGLGSILEKKGKEMAIDAIETGVGKVAKNAGKNALKNGAKEEAKVIAENTIKNATKNGIKNEGKVVAEQGIKNAAKNGIKNATKRIGTGTAENIGKNVVKEEAEQVTKRGFGNIVKQKAKLGFEKMMEKIFNSGPMKKLLGSKLAGFSSKICKFLINGIKSQGKGIVGRIAKKLTTKWGIMLVAGAVSDFIIPAAWMAGTYALGRLDVKNILQIPEESEVTDDMKNIAGIAGFIQDNVVFGFLSRSTIASFLLSLIGDDETKAYVSEQKNEMQKKYNDHISKTGENISFDEFNNKENKTTFHKIADPVVNSVKWAGKKVGEGVGAAWNGVKWAGKKVGEGANAAWNGVKWAGKKVGEGANWLYQGTKANINKTVEGAKWAGEKIGEGANWAKDKIANGAKWAGDKVAKGAGIVKNAFLKNSGFDDADVRKNLGIKEDQKITLADRFSSGTGNSLSSIMKTLSFGKLNVDPTAITKKVSGMIGLAEEGIDSIQKNVKAGVDSLDNWFGSILGCTDSDGKPVKLSTKAWETKEALIANASKAWNDLSTGTKNFIDYAGTTVSEKFNNFKEWCGNGIEYANTKLGSFFGMTDKDGKPTSLSSGIAAGVSSTVEAIKSGWSGMVTNVKGFIDNAGPTVAEKFNTFVSNVGAGLTKADNKLGSLFGLTDANGNPTSFTNGVATGVSNLISSIQSGYQSMVSSAKSFIDNAGSKLSGLYNNAMSNIGSAMNYCNTKLGTLFGMTDDNGNPIPFTEGVTKKFNDAKNGLVGAWNTVTEKAKNFYDYISKKLDSASQDRVAREGGNGGYGTVADKPNNGGFGIKGDTVKGGYGSNVVQGGGFGESPEALNGMAYYAQSDPRWAGKQYGTGTIKSSACGPTSVAMVLSSLTGKAIDPTETAAWSVNHGFRVPGVGTSWGLYSAIGKQYGVNFKQTSSQGEIMTALQQRHPVILTGTGGKPFTSKGHFVVAAGLNNGQMLINDPIGKYRPTSYSPSAVFAGMRSAFIADKPLTGAIPTGSSSTSGATAGATPPPPKKEGFMDIIGDLGKITGGFFSDTMMGKSFDAESYLAPPPTAGAPGTAGASTGGNIKMGNSTIDGGVARYASAFQAAGQKFGVDPGLLAAIAMQESGGKATEWNGAAYGIMQVENTLADEYRQFGQKFYGKPWNWHDRSQCTPEYEVPFAAYRFSQDLKHYNGDVEKAIQAYNFSHYSLDALIKATGSNWKAERGNVGRYNGTHSSSYGDPKYIEHVMRYWHRGGGNGEGDKPQGGFGFGDGEIAGNDGIERYIMPSLRNEIKSTDPINKFKPDINKYLNFNTNKNSVQNVVSAPKIDVTNLSKSIIEKTTQKINNVLQGEKFSKELNLPFDVIIKLLDRIANATEESAKKELKVTVEQKEVKSNTTNQNQSNESKEEKNEPKIPTPTMTNPFASIVNDKIGKGLGKFYSYAKEISRGKKD